MKAKCAFFCGWLTVFHLHHSLSDKSVHASTLFGSWANILDLIPDNEGLVVIKAAALCEAKEVPAKSVIVKTKP